MGGRGASSATATGSGWSVDFFGGHGSGTGVTGANEQQERVYRRIALGDKSSLNGFARSDLDVFTKAQLQEIGMRMGLFSRPIMNTSAKKGERADAVWAHMYDIVHGGQGFADKIYYNWSARR